MNMDKPGSYDFVKAKYSVTSTSFEGELTFCYNGEGVLTAFYNNAELAVEHLQFFNKNFPVVQTLLIDMAGKSKTLTIRQTTTELTFDEFYEAYNFKAGRKEAEKAWSKLTPAEQIKAFETIPSYTYFLKLRPNQNKLYPATYLNGKYDANYKELAQQLKTA
jgi:hypothetical protein